MRRLLLLSLLALCALAGGAGSAAAAGSPATPLTSAAVDISQTNPLLARAVNSGGYAAGIAPEYVEQARNIPSGGGLEVLILPQGSIRGNGTDTAVIDVAQMYDSPVDARRVEVTITALPLIRIERAVASGWSCRVLDGTATCRRARISTPDGGPNIRVYLRGAASLRAGSQPITARLSWLEPGRQGRRVVTKDVSRVRVPTAPALTVTAVRLGGLRQPSTGIAGQSPTMFKAHIGGIAGTVVESEWRQLCTTPAEARALAVCAGAIAPKATFLKPVVDTESVARQTMAVSLPAVTRPTQLHFRIIARDEADTATADVTVIATPLKINTYDPRLQKLDAAVAQMTAIQRDNLVGDRVPLVASSVVSSTGSTRFRAGRPATLRVRVPGHTIRSVAWSVARGPRTLLNGATGSGTSLQLRIPAALAGTTGVVLARATLANGDTVDASALVEVQPAPGTRTRTAVNPRLAAEAALVRQQGVVAAAQAIAQLNAALATLPAARSTVRASKAERTLCDYWTLVRNSKQAQLPALTGAVPAEAVPDIVLADGSKVWLGPNAMPSGDACGATSSIEFIQGEVLLGSNRFVNVRGEITVDGLRIRGGSYRPPDEWLELVPGMDKAIEQGTTFSVPDGIGVTAPLTREGTWRSLGGEFRVPTGLELLDLPKGWKFEPAILRFETDGLISIELRAHAEGGAQNGAASISGAYGPLGQLDIEATVSNLAVIRQADGTQVSLSGGGSLSFTWRDNPNSETEDSGLSLVVDPEIYVEAKGSIMLAENFAITELKLRWSPNEIAASGKVRVGSEAQGNYLDLEVGGEYSGADSWRFNLDASGAWKPGDNITINELKGEVERDGQTTSVSVRGRATGWTPSPAITVEQLSADITNRCPKIPSNDCDPGAVRLELDVKGTLKLPVEGATPTAWTSTARINLRTLKFTIAGSIANGSIGPEAMKLRDIQINISNEQDAGLCTPAQAPAKPSDGVRFGLLATGTVLGQEVSFTGQFGGDVGLCLVGQMKRMAPDVPDAGNFSNVFVGYASQDVTVALANGPPMQLTGKRIQLAADFRLPKAAEQIGVKGTGRFEASLASNGFTSRVAFALENRPVLFGQATGSHLRMDAVVFEFDWNGPNGTRFSAAAQFSYLTVASAATSSIASETPLAATIDFGSQGATISAGVDADRAPNGEVDNAFGISELKIRQLAVSLTLGANPNFAFDADVTLPARWSQPIGITAGSQVRLAASISQTSPCFDFAIRRPADEATSPSGRKMAVDLGGKGLLAAHQMGLTMAPTGCTVGRRAINPGFAVDFDGQIGGTIAVPVKVQAALTLPTPQYPTNFKLKTDIQVGAFNIGGAVAVDDTTLMLDIDVPANTYYLKLKGGINVLGSRSSIDAEFSATGLGNIYFRSDVQTNIGLSGLNFSGRLQLELNVKNYNVEAARLNGKLDFKVLGVTLLGANAEFEYTQGRVTVFQIGVQAGISIGIASANGKVDVEYRLLKEPQTAKDYTHRLFKVGFGGSFRVFWIRKSFYMSVVDSKVPIAKEKEAVSQNATWNDTDTQTQPAIASAPAISWPIVTRSTGKQQFARVQSITYRTAYASESTGGGPARGSASGGLDIHLCVTSTTAGGPCVADYVLPGTVQFLRSEIEVPNGIIDLNDPVTRSACFNPEPWRCAGRMHVLRGADWTTAVRMIEKARADFRAQNPGQELPPIKAWSADRAPEALGAFGGPHDRKDTRARWELSGGVQGAIPRTNGPGEIYFGWEYRVATSAGDVVYDGTHAVPLAGDWQGNGYDGIAVWYPPQARGVTARWDIRLPDGGTFAVRRGMCQTTYCQPIDPPGTRLWNNASAELRTGAKGAFWPIAGDWNGSTVDGITVDDLGTVRLDETGTLSWSLWPQNEKDVNVKLPSGFGRQANGVVDRPVTGDWNGDGVSDIGVYRGPAERGGKGMWFLWLSSTVRKAATTTGVVGDPDFTIAFGSYADFPVVGDWDNNGGDGIGVVAPRDSTYWLDARQWTLRFDADTSCGENCRSDLSPRFALSDDQYPIVGRWGP